ncbi:DUF3224 domain-containing protein [Microlunatus flavus]|uniref:DUF3224 domain-containing protein n=1 Tax=Microlunatus flavus TaxID=1036181 RepID=A0A1H9L764_9ACTN|nr:DUF3224 domain-containing protein [Microlunatus flavus]SER07274.1 Protein of unknown function [Microlunatus flavus]
MTANALATGSFTIDMTSADTDLPGAARFDFTKQWVGDLEGTGRGFMLSAGSPAAGSAGYVAQEVFEGRINGRQGALVFHQFGRMVAGSASQWYEIAPGSGTGELEGIGGTLSIEVVDGQHRVTLSYAIDDGLSAAHGERP